MAQEKKKSFFRITGCYEKPWGEMQGFTIKDEAELKALQEIFAQVEVGGRFTCEPVPEANRKSSKSPDYAIKYETKESVVRRQQKQEEWKKAQEGKKQGSFPTPEDVI